jgi:hypothetical protein
MLDLWRKLYSVADRLYALAPWSWLENDRPFGVQDPVTGEIGFIHVTGQEGQHLGISRYPEAEGLRVLMSLYDDTLDPVSGSEILLNSSQMQVSWENREELEPRDKKQIKELGLKYRGTQAWPQFRSYEPSLYPWFLTQEQASTLLTALEQSFPVFELLQKDPALFDDLDQDQYLVRIFSDGEWRDEIREVLPATEKFAVVSQIPSLPQLKALAGRKACVELDMIRMPPVGGDGPEGRPYFPHLPLLVDANSGVILSAIEILPPFPSLEAMYGKVAEKVCVSLLTAQIVPMEIRVRRQVLTGILAPLTEELGLRVTFQKHLPKLEEAVQALAGFL